MTGKRIYGLDILRAIAILSVLGTHSLPDYINKYIQIYSLDGVSLFFVLSGFLIGGILLKKINETDFKFKDLCNFWMRRWLRTLPAFYATIIVVLIFYPSVIPFPDFTTILKCLTFTQSIFVDTHKLYGEGWSLCIEEWFYLLTPIILFFCFRLFKDRKKIFLISVIVIIIISIVAKFIRTNQINYLDLRVWDNNIRRAVVFRFDSIMFGVLGAYLYYYKAKIWQYRNAFFISGIILFVFNQVVLFGNISVTGHRFFSLTIQSIATLFLLPKLNSIRTGKGLIFKILTFISIISYSLYLMNATPFSVIAWPLVANHLTIHRAFFYILFTYTYFHLWAFVSAYLMYRLIERPFMNMREKFSKKPMVASSHIPKN
jgi:peptidoglycan/LPS O-acetylase OafA/YrhL